MADPIIAANHPTTVSLTAGEEKYWCACGRSENQPFCDGSHAETEFSPIAFTPDEDGEAALCVCKRTGNPPYCDGSHAQFDDADVGTDGSGTDGTDPSGRDEESEDDAADGNRPPRAKATSAEPTVAFIHQLARDGLSKLGHHGPMTAMGVPRKDLPHWDDLQIMAAQMATKPLLDDHPRRHRAGRSARRPTNRCAWTSRSSSPT